MTDQDLARRAVACKHWRWMPGVLTTHGARILEHCGTEAGEDVYAFASTAVIVGVLDEGERPDFRDPATRGCLLQLVREAWGNPRIYCTAWREGHDESWMVVAPDYYTPIPWLHWNEATETEALVAALEAAAKGE